MESSLEYEKQRLRQIILNKGLKWSEGFERNHIPKWIFDLREVVLTPEGSSLAAKLIFEKIKNIDFDLIGGPSIAAEPLIASILAHSYKSGKNISGFIVRKNPNNFGLRKKIEGPIGNGKKVVIIDDVVNMGITLPDVIKHLKQEGCIIIKILTLVDFHKSGHYKFEEEGYDVDFIFRLNDFNLDSNINYNHSMTAIKEYKTQTKDEIDTEKLNSLTGQQITDYKIIKNSLLASTSNGEIYCIDKTTYSIVWQIVLGESISAPLLVNNGMVVVSVYSGLRMSQLSFIRIENGSVLKQVKINGKIHCAPLLHKDYYYVGTSEKKLYSVNKNNYDTQCIFETSGSIMLNPLIESGTIYLPSSDGNIYSIDGMGNLIWQRHYGNLKLLPVLFEDFLILKSETNIIFCINKKDGSLNWSFEMKNRVNCIKILFGKLWIGCVLGYIFSFEPISGNLLKSFKVTNDDILALDHYGEKIVVKLNDGKQYELEETN